MVDISVDISWCKTAEQIVSVLDRAGYDHSHIHVLEDTDTIRKGDKVIQTTYYQVGVKDVGSKLFPSNRRYFKKYAWIDKHLAYQFAAELMEKLRAPLV